MGERLTIVSADGHANAKMEDYREYIDADLREDFDDFVDEFKKYGARSWEVAHLANRLDPEWVADWDDRMIQAGRIEGEHDPDRRLAEMEAEGVVAEVLFPDFGIPFEPAVPWLARTKGLNVRQDAKYRWAGMMAYNRWVLDFVARDPKRLIPQVIVPWDDVDRAVETIRWARSHGMSGVVMPQVEPELPLYHARFEPIWSVLEELSMPLNVHITISYSGPPEYCFEPDQKLIYLALVGAENMVMCRRSLNVMILGGIFEKHPDLRVVFTENHSDWVIDAVRRLDFQWDRSFLRRDFRQHVPRPPSEYWRQNCFLGSSLLSREEAAAAATIGIDKMMFGVDYPHHEGAWTFGTSRYLRETVGAAEVALDDTRRIVSENALDFWDLDREYLARLGDRVGPEVAEVLSPPTTLEIPRGDAWRPLI